ncbi:MAG: transposase [Sedimentisphaerales bacterium]|nr:transposase [Sedimentisphaerales bacterium]HOC65156.1 transposase [Sedimentisphaerales bacterium]HOH66158.1 transposase [Sedimentisphaerales bacterium]HQA89419.1 transposase [Sedimentisphaerales bacterium]HQN35680.1 transposase [Sedimentisphaerales bacterium]
MPNYIRRYKPGGTFFFTVVTHGRRRLFGTDRARSLLHEAVLAVKRERPFELVATVLLPDHWHCVWTLPEGDFDYSKRWGIIKSRFSRQWLAVGGQDVPVSAARVQHRERGVWQKRFWEHKIRDERDFIRHVNYIHYNPVKHGLVRCPHDWPYSSFQRWVNEGYYAEDWLCDCGGKTPAIPEDLRRGLPFAE